MIRNTFAIVLSTLTTLSACANAQVLVGQFGNACVTLGPSSTMTLTIAQPIPANSLIIASVGVDSSVFDNVFSDNSPGGGSYGSGSVGAQNGTVLIPFSRYSALVTPAGTTFTWTMVGGNTRKACMNISAFSGTLPTQALAVAQGVNSGVGAAASATTTTPVGLARSLVFGLTTHLGDPGTVTPGPGITLLNKNCLGAPAFCLQSGFSVSNSAATQTLTNASGVSSNWQMGVNAYVSNTIHVDGFE